MGLISQFMADPARQRAHPAFTHRQILSVALQKMLLPLVRILLRSGIPYGLFADIAKQAYVKIASEEFNISGRKQTVSRMAVITGLKRFLGSKKSQTSTPPKSLIDITGPPGSSVAGFAMLVFSTNAGSHDHYRLRELVRRLVSWSKNSAAMCPRAQFLMSWSMLAVSSV